MNKQSKLFMVFAIAFYLVMAPTALSAKKKPGADVLITKKDGTQVAGELISVKREFITVMAGGSGVNVDLKEIRDLRMKKRMKGEMILIGGLVGAACGAAIGLVASGGKMVTRDMIGISYPGLLGTFGGLFGTLSGIGAASDKTHILEGAPINITEEILSKLDKQARFPSGIKWRKNWF
jgi:hypothetical protein